MEKFEELNSFEETNAFLHVAIHLGWISSQYEGYGNNISDFLDNPYKWQSEYEFMVKWVRDNIEVPNTMVRAILYPTIRGPHIFDIIDQEKEEEFLGAYHLWIKGRDE